MIVVHLGLIAASRQRQLAQLSKYIARDISPADPVIVAGDFNSPLAPVRWAQTALSSSRNPTPQESANNSSQVLHALRGHATFPSRLPLLQLDHVFVRHASIVSTHVLRGGQWARMSDHLPLIVEVQL